MNNKFKQVSKAKVIVSHYTCISDMWFRPRTNSSDIEHYTTLVLRNLLNFIKITHTHFRN